LTLYVYVVLSESVLSEYAEISVVDGVAITEKVPDPVFLSTMNPSSLEEVSVHLISPSIRKQAWPTMLEVPKVPKVPQERTIPTMSPCVIRGGSILLKGPESQISVRVNYGCAEIAPAVIRL